MTAQTQDKAESTALITTDRRHALASMAARYGCTESKLRETMKATVLPKGATDADFVAFVIVANQYDLNPLTKQIHAFPAKGGGITPMVGVDGWIALVNRHPDFDGFEIEQDDESATCTMFLKNRKHPVRITEYMDECKRNTDPWNKSPKRMLRHKAYIQCARVAFGLAGIYDEDEARDRMRDVTPHKGELAAARDHVREQIKEPQNPFDAPPQGVVPEGADKDGFLEVPAKKVAAKKTAKKTAPELGSNDKPRQDEIPF